MAIATKKGTSVIYSKREIHSKMTTNENYLHRTKLRDTPKVPCYGPLVLW